MSTNNSIYNRAKTWQIAGFALNNVATNLFMMLMVYVSFYATGVAGLSVILISSLLTSMRMFDAVTDPIIGFVIDKTKTKFGKFRPSMIIGYVIMSASVLLLYNFTHVISESIRLPFFIITYAAYIIGYTFQTACTKAAQACLTNDPSQRPMFTRFDGIYCTFIFAAIAQYVSGYISPKYGGFTAEAMREFSITFVILAGIATLIAVISIASKDKEEFFGLGKKSVKVKFKDYINILKNNRPMQMLVVSAATDKLALQVSTNSVVMVMLYGIVMGNYALYGKMSMITMIPTLIIVILGTKYASKVGAKKGLIGVTILSMIGYTALFLILLLGDPTKISLENFGPTAAIWIVTYCFAMGVKQVSSSIVIPMIADCSDYETYKSGRYVPGMMGTLFSFVDKIVSSFATTIIGLAVAAIGYTSAMPEATDVSTPQMFWTTVALFIGLPIFGWICSLIAMKFYELDEEKMEEIQAELSKIRESEMKKNA